jgi:hypothetical protein
MLIAPHPTPNPNAHKYVLPARFFAQPRNVSTAEAAAADPLTARLFALEGVYNVFCAQDFVTINKRPETPWEVQVLAILTDYVQTEAGSK